MNLNDLSTQVATYYRLTESLFDTILLNKHKEFQWMYKHLKFIDDNSDVESANTSAWEGE